MNQNEILNQKITMAMGEHQIARIAMQAEIEALRQKVAELAKTEVKPDQTDRPETGA